jgi:hypothetical protein
VKTETQIKRKQRKQFKVKHEKGKIGGKKETFLTPNQLISICQCPALP